MHRINLRKPWKSGQVPEFGSDQICLNRKFNAPTNANSPGTSIQIGILVRPQAPTIIRLNNVPLDMSWTAQNLKPVQIGAYSGDKPLDGLLGKFDISAIMQPHNLLEIVWAHCPPDLESLDQLPVTDHISSPHSLLLDAWLEIEETGSC